VIDLTDVGDHLVLKARLDEEARRRFLQFVKHHSPSQGLSAEGEND